MEKSFSIFLKTCRKLRVNSSSAGAYFKREHALSVDMTNTKPYVFRSFNIHMAI